MFYLASGQSRRDRWEVPQPKSKRNHLSRAELMRLRTFCASFPFLRRARVSWSWMGTLAGLEGSDACRAGMGVGGGGRCNGPLSRRPRRASEGSLRCDDNRSTYSTTHDQLYPPWFSLLGYPLARPPSSESPRPCPTPLAHDSKRCDKRRS